MSDCALRADFFNWNRVRIRYCDGASFNGAGQDEVGWKILSFCILYFSIEMNTVVVLVYNHKSLHHRPAKYLND